MSIDTNTHKTPRQRRGVLCSQTNLYGVWCGWIIAHTHCICIRKGVPSMDLTDLMGRSDPTTEPSHDVPPKFISTRKMLGLDTEELAALIGVSGETVSAQDRPSQRQKASSINSNFSLLRSDPSWGVKILLAQWTRMKPESKEKVVYLSRIAYRYFDRKELKLWTSTMLQKYPEFF